MPTAKTMSFRHLGHGAIVSLVAAWSITTACFEGIKIRCILWGKTAAREMSAKQPASRPQRKSAQAKRRERSFV
jgi:hypothetical protein